MMTLKEKLDKVRGKLPFAQYSVVNKRNKICRECEHILALYRCKKCGCFMDFKTRIKNSKCPIGKW